MIIEFEPNSILLSVPSKWWLYYREDNEANFNKILVTYTQLKTFLELYGYETNNLLELQKFGINTNKIESNKNLN